MTASRWRTPRSSAARIANVTTPVSSPAGSSGMPKSRWKPSAAPTNSARSQAIATASACNQRKMRIGFEKRVAADLGEVVAGGDAELRAHRLDQHRHQVRGQDDPEQQVAVLGARGDVGGEVARVDVGDRGDERRAEERPQPAQAPAPLGQRALRRLQHLLLAGQRDGRQFGAHGGGGFTRTADADALRELARDGMALAGDLDRQRPVEGRVREHDDALVRHEAELGEVAQEPGIAVRARAG